MGAQALLGAGAVVSREAAPGATVVENRHERLPLVGAWTPVILRHVRAFVRSRPRLDGIRRAVRFYQQVSPREWLRPGKLLAARRARPYTLVSYPRLSRLYDLVSGLAEEHIPGTIVECGVCNGGSAAMMALAARHGGVDRDIWLFDSWEGLPEPGPFDVTAAGARRERGWNLGSKEVVEHLLFARLRLPRSRVHLVKGWFDETLPRHRAALAPIALLHLDGDWYESTKVCLDELYDVLSPGAYVVLDDYGHWQGCKKAVDEFVASRGLALSAGAEDDSAFFTKPT